MIAPKSIAWNSDKLKKLKADPSTAIKFTIKLPKISRKMLKNG